MAARSDGDVAKGKLLVVDDEEIIRHSLRLALGRHGYQVSTTESPRKALKELKDNNFDLVLTDIRMPEMDGVRMLKEIRKVAPEIPVIFITGYPSIQTAAEGLSLGAEDYITKPFHKTEKILTPVERALAKAREKREGKPVSEGEGEKIECEDCHYLFSLGEWQPRTPCPACHFPNTFPRDPEDGEEGKLDCHRFARIAKWSDLIGSREMVDSLTRQRELRKAGKLVPPIGEIMVEKGYLTRREVRAILKVQSIRKPDEEETRFGKIAVANNFMTKEQLKRCLDIQARMILYQGKSPLLGEILLERGYITERQIKKILKFQQTKKRGIFQYLDGKRISPVRRVAGRLLEVWQEYPGVRAYGLALALMLLLCVAGAYFIVRRRGYLFSPSLTVVDSQGVLHEAAPGDLSPSREIPDRKLFYALFCKKCTMWFPLRIDSASPGNFSLQACPKCGGLANVEVPESVRKVIAHEQEE